MPAFSDLLWFHGQFLGIDWHAWKVVGWLGNLAFFSRFLVQWYATEKHQRVVVPVLFWWLSLLGSLFLLAYAAFYRRDSVFIFAYAFTWIPYIRNLIIHHRHQNTTVTCTHCASSCPAQANFCAHCGTPVVRP